MPAKRAEAAPSKAPSTKKPTTRSKRTPVIGHDEIATRAYYIHLEGGRDPVENWVQAERELVGV
jgi:hypothetical protein